MVPSLRASGARARRAGAGHLRVAWLTPLVPLALLAGCGSRNDDVGAVSPEEDRLLNDAASSLQPGYMTPDNSMIVNFADGNAADGNAIDAGATANTAIPGNTQ